MLRVVRMRFLVDYFTPKEFSVDSCQRQLYKPRSFQQGKCVLKSGEIPALSRNGNQTFCLQARSLLALFPEEDSNEFNCK